MIQANYKRAGTEWGERLSLPENKANEPGWQPDSQGKSQCSGLEDHGEQLVAAQKASMNFTHGAFHASQSANSKGSDLQLQQVGRSRETALVKIFVLQYQSLPVDFDIAIQNGGFEIFSNTLMTPNDTLTMTMAQ